MSTQRRRLSAPVLVAGTGAAALLVTTVVLAVVFTSDRTDYPLVTASVSLLAAGAFIVSGLVAHTRQPANLIGRLMVVAGFVQLLSLLANAETALPFTVGVALQPVSTALFAHLLLSFPTGRLRSRTDQVLVTLGYVDAVAVQLVMLLVMDDEGAGICPCPPNLLYVWDAHAFHDVLMTTQRLLGVLLTMAIVAVVAGRWFEASPPLRRSLTPVLSTGAATAILGGLWYGTWQFTDGTVTDVLALLATAALALLPLGFLVGLLRARLARAAVGDLVIELGRAMRPGEVRDALARALGDPALQLAYYRDDGAAAVDLLGAPVELPEPGSGQVLREVVRDGRRIAVVVHDASLADSPELVDAAVAAATLALENERLQASLRARLEDLRASRARIVAAGDTERRRLERNLHDGAQQRLVSVSMGLTLARSALASRPAEALEIVGSAQRDLTEAIGELRELARGIHPSVLTNRGLAAALEALASRAPLPVELDVVPGRLPDGVEAAVYYVVSEAVTNVVRYASARGVVVRVSASSGAVTAVVSDDGVGGADPAAGSGLRGLADRVEALDGTLTVVSPPGEGTTVTVVIPCG